MKVQHETFFHAETLFRVTVSKPAKRLLGIAADRQTAQKPPFLFYNILLKIIGFNLVVSSKMLNFSA